MMRTTFSMALAALALSACNALDDDRAPVGADHVVRVVTNHGQAGSEAMFRDLEQRAMVRATERCQAEGAPLVVLRKAFPNVNELIMTYRCRA